MQGSGTSLIPVRAPGAAVAALGVVGLAMSFLAPGSVSAAVPVGRGLYVSGPYEGRVELRVSSSARWLVPSGSRVEVRTSCGRLAFRIGRRGRPVRIDRGGRFEFRRSGPRAVRLRGRFVTRDRVRVAIGYRPSLGPPVPVECGARERLVYSLERVRRKPLRDCRTHPEKSVLDAATGRAFNGLYYGRNGWENVAWACLFSENRRVILGRRPYDTDDAGFGPFELVGAFVAFRREFECFAMSCPDWWKLGENGAVGLIAAGSAWVVPLRLEVWMYGPQGPRRLDSGNIAWDSLELEGSTLRWLKDGVRQSV